MKKVIFLGLSFIHFLAYSTSYTVTNASEITAKMSSVVAGDTLVMKNGTWSGQTILFAPANTGTASQPIVLAAQTPGMVVLSGASKLNISGSYLTVTGLKFTNGGSIGSSDVVAFRKNASDWSTNHCRLTNCAFIDYNGSENKWVALYGDHNRVDNCYFKGKTTAGSTVLVNYNATGKDPGDVMPPTYHQIDHNYFGTRTMPGSNDGESIRIGESDASMSKGYNVIEYNYFEKTLKEVEVITNKSCNNTYRYNTFFDNEGALVLRHGNNCLVEGNYFFGNQNPNSCGIRIIGEDHVVINNYLQDLRRGTVSNLSAPITIMDGIQDSPLNGYYQVKNAIVAFNTIVNCNGPAIRVGSQKTSPYMKPLNLTIANNIVYNPTGKSPSDLAIYEEDAPISKTYDGNMYYSSTTISLTGWSHQTAALLSLNGSLYRPSMSSPAVNAAAGTYTNVNQYAVDKDMEGQPRSDTWDVGADERSGAESDAGPLTISDVGPCFMKPSGCSSPILSFKAGFQPVELSDLYPSPAEGNLNVLLQIKESCDGRIEISDMDSRVMLIQEKRLNSGENNFKLNITGLKSGIYMINIITETGSVTRRFSVMN